LRTKRPSSIGGLSRGAAILSRYTQIWAANDRPEFERLMLNTNPHPLARFARAIAAPSNMPPFSQAFGCKNGDAMVRAAASAVKFGNVRNVLDKFVGGGPSLRPNIEHRFC